MGDVERDGELLLDEQDGNAAAGDLGQEIPHQGDQARRETLGGLVDQDQIRIAHQGSTNREQLLLAT